MNSSKIKNVLKRFVKNKEKRHRLIIKTTSWIPDALYLRILYLFICKSWLSFRKPKTYNEKLQWYKLYYRSPLMTKCADKYAVRSYVEDCGYVKYLVPLFFRYENADAIDFSLLPNRCILKTTHNSSGSVKWDAGRDNDTEGIRKTFDEMLGINAFWLAREWAYKDIVPQIICEQWINSEKPIVDVKFLCFNGKVRYIYYDSEMNDEYGNHAIGNRAVLDSAFSPIDITTSMHRLPDEKVVIFDCMREILEAAEILSKPFPHVRVDFFIADGKPYFSELTFYSGGGYGTLSPKKWDEEIGKCFLVDGMNK